MSGTDEAASDIKRNNFPALVLCLMLGTATMPDILARLHVTPSAAEARALVFWALFFVILVYITVPALIKFDLYTSLVGTDFSRLPSWVLYRASIDKANPLTNITDINKDGIVQLAEITMDSDMVVPATPETAGLPHVISGSIVAGGLAAALSTAAGLLLAIATALSHDTCYKVVDPHASTWKRVTISALLLVAPVAAYAASLKPGDILSMVGTAFSLAASILFPALVLGVFWKRINHFGALAGSLVCVYYMIHTLPALGGSASAQWFDIAPVSAGIYGVPAGLVTMIVFSMLFPARDALTGQSIDHVHAP